ncbi:hypothetical protein J9303_00485 [Bacillaceae bacterium Marseille-Q3522]|nr:hypothetical protein [Bacillaceae bacterium Marseille-Q3522]
MDITQEIADTLAVLYPAITIYRNNQSQGFIEPCFFIKQIQATGKEELFNRQFRNYVYDVLYFPENEKASECEWMAESLQERFCYLRDRSLKVINKEHSISENVLHFTFNLKFRAVAETVETKMQQLTEGADIKNGN